MIFSKVNRGIKNIVESFNAFTLVLLAVTLFVSVVARYVFSASIPETEVIRKFCIAWLVFMGSAIAVKEKHHLEIDIFTEYLSARLVRIKNIIVYVLMLTAILILVFVGVAAFNAGINRTEMVSIRFLSDPPSLAYYYTAVLVGSIFMLYFHIVNARKLLELPSNEVNKK
ncbi:TRAP transporter small permease [Alteribacillus bidgolensis]|uniref:TRAP-type C4-dicarboxylate transport system, small permease component n=1 Tax=Alteribacillus bidgolensis TaxID=930129 RepID=A0A1G8NHZ0_9BACI|nr:TRAP transporter small permease subunit [Alteribacillus bidgolensis]SDI79778.1 TRAP-type C4-dicarboxylate transport system, small permease component [Alteribacillus bidgolensis]